MNKDTLELEIARILMESEELAAQIENSKIPPIKDLRENMEYTHEQMAKIIGTEPKRLKEIEEEDEKLSILISLGLLASIKSVGNTLEQ